MAEWIVPLLASVVAAAFAAVVLAQHRERPRASHAAWGVGLVLYSVASLAEAWGFYHGWGPVLYRAYYPVASGLVGFLGLGTLYLLRDSRVGTAFAGVILATFTFIALGAALAPLDAAALAASSDPGLKLITGAPRVASVVLNVAGGLVLVLGAFWSWFETRQNGVLLIGLGALVPLMGGTFSSLGVGQARHWAQLIGVAVMFTGFMLARAASRGASASYATPVN